MMEIIHGAECQVAEIDGVRLAVTKLGGHLTADFRLGDRVVSPYALAPWKPDEVGSDLPVLLTHLRGDFLCLPFGPQDDGPPHGDSANGEWRSVEGETRGVHLVMRTSDTKALVKKTISLREGHRALYIEHAISELVGEWSYGSHPVLDFSTVEEGRVSVSPFRWACVNPGVFSDPVNREYQALKPGAKFDDLREVPLMNGGTTDLTRYPARQGFDDLVMMVSEEGDAPFAWTACVMDGYVWFSLKNAADFPATLFWISNGGRHGEPWAGNHQRRLGLEEVCSYFAESVTESRKTPLTGEGIPTVREFDGSHVSLRLIQGVAGVPEDFDLVKDIVPDGEGRVTLRSGSGVEITVELDWGFLRNSPEAS
jgi:hypothetical protein